MTAINLRGLSDEDLLDAVSRQLEREDVSAAPYSFRTGLDDLIDAASTAQRNDPLFVSQLTDVLNRIVEELVRYSANPAERNNVRLVQILGAIAFVATELKLSLNNSLLILSTMVAIEICQDRPELQNDLLLLLRAVGRFNDPYIYRVFWSKLLEYPDRGIRTVAAQNLARADVGAVLASLDMIVGRDINNALLAHTILREAGSPEGLVALAHMHAAKIDILRSILTEAGERETVAALSGISVVGSVIYPFRRQEVRSEVVARLHKLFQEDEVREVAAIYSEAPRAVARQSIGELVW